jgi:hypothetical protein
MKVVNKAVSKVLQTNLPLLVPSTHSTLISGSIGFAGYVSVCMQLYCVGFHYLSLHILAYMATFMCVGYFYFQMSEGC